MASLINMSGGALLNKGLPYDAEIEYLENSGTQYIDTGIIPDVNTKITADIQLLATTRMLYLFGFYSTGQQYFLYIGNVDNNPYQFAWSSNYVNTQRTADTDRHIFELYSDGEYSYLVVDGEIVSTRTTVSQNATKTLPLFIGREDNTIRRGSRQKLYSFVIRKNGNVVANFIPVRVDNVGYLYDKVSKQLFGNAGTGAFILGPDKTN